MNDERLQKKRAYQRAYSASEAGKATITCDRAMNLPPTTPAPGEATLWNVSNDDYHKTFDAIGSSMLKAFIDSPCRYAGVYVERTIPPKPPTDDMVLGTWLHCKVLEPDQWEKRYVIGPKCDRRYKEGKADWAAFLQSVNGQEVINNSDLPRVDLAHGMAEAIRQDPFAAKLLKASSRKEQGILYRDRVTGLLLKAKPDAIALNSRCIMVGDLKSSACPGDGFGDQAYRLKYHLQMALYSNAVKALTGLPVKFIFIVVGKTEPFPVFHYEMDSAFQELGQAELRDALCKLQIAYDTGEWKSEGQGKVTLISPPRWAKRYNQGITSMFPAEV